MKMACEVYCIREVIPAIIIIIIIVIMIKFKSTAVFSKNVIKQLVRASAVCMSRYKAIEKFGEHS